MGRLRREREPLAAADLSRHAGPGRHGRHEENDFLLGKVFPRRAEVIDTGTLRALLGP